MIAGTVVPAAGQPNADEVRAIEAMLKARFQSAFPFLLLPVRIETRFVQTEVPFDHPVLPADLLARLHEIRASLDDIAGRDLATIVVGKGHATRREVKDGAEQALYAFVEARLATARDSAQRLAADAPSCYQGDAVSLEQLRGALAALSPAVDRAATSLGRLRSPWHRERLTATLAEFRGGVLAAAVESVERHTLPALRLFVESGPGLQRVLTGRIGAAGGAAAPGRHVTRAAFARGAALSERASEQLTALSLRLDRPRPDGDARADARAVTDGAQQIAALFGEIAALPDGRRAALTTDAQRVAARARILANTVDSQARLGSADADATATLAQNLRRAAAALEDAVRRVPGESTLPGGAAARPTRLVNQLRVRIFPDDLLVQTHEADLTAGEIDSGRAFWRETMAAGTDETLKRAAWRALVRKHGSRRAAWIARRLEPTLPHPPFDPGPLMKALELLERRIDEILQLGVRRLKSLATPIERVTAAVPDRLDLNRPIRARLRDQFATIAAKQKTLARAVAASADPIDDQPLKQLAATLTKGGRWLDGVDAAVARDGEPSTAPVFPALAPKAGTWTQSPRSTVLPGRFVVMAIAGGRVRHAVAGRPVDPDLKLGLNPDPAQEAEEAFAIDADGELTVADSIRWMVDYDEAVGKGMAITVELTADEARDGFDRLYLIGVKDATATDAQHLLEGLLEDHHFGPNGLGFLRPGTPTNNTEQSPSGFASADDADATFDIERKDPLFAYNPAHTEDASDALRFARALGIAPAAVDHVVNAGAKDVSEALLVNAALWPATVGAYLEDFLVGVVGADAIRRLRAFFLPNVIARGNAPILRVGDQPYGLLTTTAFSAYQPATGAVLPPPPGDGAPNADAARAARFSLLLRDLLAIANDDWSRLAAQKVKHAHSSNITDPQQHFLDMLGQDPTSSSWGYRYAVNVAQRQPPPRVSIPGFDFTYPRAAAGAISTAALQGPVALLARFAAVYREARGLPADAPLVDAATGLVAAPFAPSLDALLGAGAYTVRFLAAPRHFTGIIVDDRAATWIPQLLAATASSLADEARQGHLRSRTLLYVLLRYALLAAQRDATRDVLLGDGLDEETWIATGSAEHFLVVDLFGPNANTKWSWLFQRLSAIDARAAGELPAGVNTLRKHLTDNGDAAMERYLSARGANQLFQTSPLKAKHSPALNQLTDHAAAVSALAAIPADRLTALVQEHIDVCSHRLDAWRLGLAHQRLGELRARNANGVYVGAFGWVEDLRPDPPRHPASSVPAALQRRGETIFEAPGNEGFVHTPSLSHAVTAAILRSGYLSEAARRDLDNRMAVNLSSRRVRVALDLIDGIAAGSSMSSLLGYRLERFLHEAYESQQVTLDDLIYRLRRAFPALAPVDPDAPATSQAERAIVDGMALLGTIRSSLDRAGRVVAPGATLFDTLRDGGAYTGHPWGVVQRDHTAVLPPTSDSARLDGFLRAVDHIADALDAVGDLALAEAVYQLARGNHMRAAAVLGALAEGKPLPRPEIVDTPRSGTMLTHRLFLVLPRVDGARLSRSTVPDDVTRDANRRAAAPPAWATIPMTPRACAEPALNRWLGAALGNPAQIVARVAERESGAEVAVVSAQDLGLQPIDLLALAGPGLDGGGGELGARILSFALPALLDPKAPPPLRKVMFDPGDWSAGQTTFLQASALCQAVHDLLGKSRAAIASDFLDEASKTSGPPRPVDTTELESRVRGTLAELETIGASLADLLSNSQQSDAAALDDGPTFVANNAAVYRNPDGNVAADAILARRADFAARLLRASSLGIPGAIPPSYYGDDASFARDLLERSEGAFVESAARRARAKTALDTATNGDTLIKALRLLLGEDAPLLTPFVLRNADAIDAALSADLLRDAGRRPIERWLHSVSTVRDRTGFARQALVLADALGMAPPASGVAQLPLEAGDRWLGVELPPNAPPPQPKLSLVLLGRDALDTDGGPSVALLVDEWNETIPGESETTGIALHADQPDATPPQSMLLVVPPVAPPANGTGRWSLEELVRALDDTLEMTRSRLVEPEHLADDVYAQVLPALAGELIPDAIRDRGAPLGDRVPLDFGTAGHGAG